APEIIEDRLPASAPRGVDGGGRAGEWRRRDVGHEAEEGCEPGEEAQQLDLGAQRAQGTGLLPRAVFGREARGERLLEAGDLLIEAQTLGREGVRRGESLRSLEPLVPLAPGHSFAGAAGAVGASLRTICSYQARW